MAKGMVTQDCFIFLFLIQNGSFCYSGAECRHVAQDWIH